MKKVVSLILCLLFSVAIVLLLPRVFNNTEAIDIEHTNETSIVPQEVLGYSDDSSTYHKLYYKGQLVGVVSNIDYFNDLLNDEYYRYEEKFPNASMGLIDDCYIVDETSNIIFENIDDKIAQKAIDDNYIGIKTTAVEFSTNEGIYEIIYVNSKDDFYTARDEFLQNFISDEALNKIANKEPIDSPTEFGAIETNLKIQETVSFSESIVAPDEIFTSTNEIYEFLCYGRNSERQYYETKVGDTVQAVGYHFGDMSAKQVMMLNPDIIFDEDQILAPGTVLNVTYYESPITVVVTKQRLSQETVLPDSPLYKEDETLKQGSRRIEIEEENGLRNVLFEETWINGVIQEGKEISSNMIKEPTQGVIVIGTMTMPDIGTGNWGWPVANPQITCSYTCYSNHGGVDFQNRYNFWGEALAADSGVVESVGYTDVGGYFVRINHNNSFMTYYGHMRTYPYVAVGQVVERGDVLGPIGMTGIATGPHVHFAMYYNGNLIDPCSVMACSMVPRG